MRKLIYFSGLLLFFSSCGWLNPSIMLKTGKNYQYAKNPDSTKIVDYKISVNDLIQFNMYTNDGFRLIDLSTLNTAGNINASSQYLVESDGTVKLPVLGRKKLTGLTIREAEVLLEEVYSEYYVKPFVTLKVSNRRVILFPGAAGTAKVIPLTNNNTTLIEALASAGGLAIDGKAKLVKLIRDNNGKHDVYKIDLSTIDGLTDGNTVLQANDIIYVEPRRRYSSKFLAEIAPIISLLTSTYIIYTYSNSLKN